MIAGVISGILWLGRKAGDKVANEARYTVPFSQISCEHPPGVDRLAFLTEVRYISSLPETLQSVEAGLADQLKAAFSKHPWVSQVEEVKITPDAKIEVVLKFRLPVLLIRVTSDNEVRVVDKQGILLPSGSKLEQLPQLTNPMLAPVRPAGELWDDPTIRRAAELVELYKPQKPTSIEKTAKGWRLTLEGGRTVVVSL